jgi:hypothetical protein
MMKNGGLKWKRAATKQTNKQPNNASKLVKDSIQKALKQVRAKDYELVA